MDREPDADPPRHVPVLLDRCLDLLAPALRGPERPVAVDATLGLGGHAEALLAVGPDVELVGFDRDPAAQALAGARLAGHGSQFHPVHAPYDRMAVELERLGISEVHVVLFDLGVSSLQLDEVDRGFAYSRNAPLDMRMDPTTGRTAAEVLNTYAPAELIRILREYGEERFATKIVRAIVAERDVEPFSDSARLVELLYRVIPAATRRTGGHPAKRTFQALRIEVNGELESLRAALPQALDALAVGGRMVVLSYHSLEDVIVKRAIAELAKSRTPEGLPVELPGHGPQLRVLTRGAEQATGAEIDANPRAASVRMRAVERIAPAGGVQ